MDNLHCLRYMDGQPSLPALPGWTTLIAGITWMDKFRCLHFSGWAVEIVRSVGSGRTSDAVGT
eukprot:10123453-Karenia_brevis.AAC.1